MPSLMEALETREAAARARVAELRDEIAQLTEVLGGAESEVSRLVITRETVAVVLADGPRPASGSGRVLAAPVDFAVALTAAEAAGDPMVVSAEYQQVLAVVAAAGNPVRCKEVCPAVGLPTGAGDVEAMRRRLKRLADRGLLAETGPGLFTVNGSR